MKVFYCARHESLAIINRDETTIESGALKRLSLRAWLMLFGTEEDEWRARAVLELKRVNAKEQHGVTSAWDKKIRYLVSANRYREKEWRRRGRADNSLVEVLIERRAGRTWEEAAEDMQHTAANKAAYYKPSARWRRWIANTISNHQKRMERRDAMRQ